MKFFIFSEFKNKFKDKIINTFPTYRKFLSGAHFKLDLNKNIFKSTFAGNLFALLGLSFVSVCLFLYVYFFITCGYKNCAGLGEALFFTYIIIGYAQIFLILTALFIFFIELLIKHRLKTPFWTENKIYTVFFYIGTLLNIAFIYLIIKMKYI